jgi:hypothetical protein
VNLFDKLVERLFFSDIFDKIRRQYFKEAYEQGKFEILIEINKEGN